MMPLPALQLPMVDLFSAYLWDESEECLLLVATTQIVLLSHCSGLFYATISKRGSLTADLLVFWLLRSFHPLFCGIP